jgi:hypothetical protein
MPESVTGGQNTETSQGQTTEQSTGQTTQQLDSSNRRSRHSSSPRSSELALRIPPGGSGSGLVYSLI